MRIRKVVTRLQEGEAIVVGNVEDLRAIENLFRALHKMDHYSKSDQQRWLEAARHFANSIAESERYFNDVK